MAVKRIERTTLNPTLRVALQSDQTEAWTRAIDKEMMMLRDMDSYDLVLKSQVPRHCQILQSKMHLTTKITSTGEVDKLKVRLVALGNLEWDSIRDTFAPTVNGKTINLMLALAAQEGMIIHGFDVSGLFSTHSLVSQSTCRCQRDSAPRIRRETTRFGG
jgi:hypothetical protein